MFKFPKPLFEEPDEHGHPQDGDELPTSQFELPIDADDEEPVQDDQDPQAALAKQLAELNEKMSRMEAENEALKRAIPPTQPAPVQQAPDPIASTDWGEKFYNDPNAAVQDIVTQAVQKAVTQVTSAYQKDQSTKDFWNQFYGAHSDLAEDRDLVSMTLNANMDTLSPLPVKEAMDKLAALTRARIARYKEGSGKKVVVEGGGGPTQQAAPQQRQQQQRPQTLSDVIRERRRKRASAA